MNDDRVNERGTAGESPARPRFGAAEDALAIDLRALGRRTARDLPTLHHTMLAVREGRAQNTPGGFVMSMLNGMKRRPMYSSLALGAVIALALLVVPVSYVRTLGQDVALTFSAPGLGEETVDAIAKEYVAALGGDGVRVAVDVTDDGLSGPQRIYRLATHVPSRSRGATERVASAFAGALTKRGITAIVAVSPRTEKVSGNVYAAAENSICNLTIDSRGKNAEEIEGSIKSQLEAAGIQNPTVDVSLDGNLTTVQIQAQDACGRPGTSRCEIKLRVDGEAVDEANMVTLHCDPNASCDDMRARIEEELRSRGIDANVTVTGDGCTGESCRVEVKVEKR